VEELSGILIIDKPADWTSHDVVGKLRGLFNLKRIGHAGTLDPMATGVLVVFVGRATRAVQFAEADEKEYEAGLRLGLETDTQDIWGETLRQTSRGVTPEALEAVLPQFRGAISQIPPMYSAIKRQGKKLYELARRGETVEREPRPVYIHRLELLDGAGQDYRFAVTCSKGTYIRTLCHDIGQALETGGVMSALRRTRSGRFSLTDAVTLSDVEASDNRAALLLPVETLFMDHPRLELAADLESRHRNGQAIRTGAAPGTYRVYSGSTGTFLSLGQVAEANGLLKAIKSFYSI